MFVVFSSTKIFCTAFNFEAKLHIPGASGKISKNKLSSINCLDFGCLDLTVMSLGNMWKLAIA